MKLLLSAPFNSELNLSTFNAYVDVVNTIDELHHIINDINEESDNYDWKLSWEKPNANISLYRSLNDNYTPNASRPIIELKVNNTAWLKTNLSISLFETTGKNIDDLDIDFCTLYFYDNTISILSLCIEDRGHHLSFADIDDLTFDICNILVTSFKPILQHMIHNLKRHPYFEAQQGNDEIFYKGNYSVYWVNRSLFINDSQYTRLETEIKKWCKFHTDDNITHDYIDYKIIFCIGNNVIITEIEPYGTYIQSINMATYFYCLYFFINNRVSKIFEDIENISLFEKNYKLLYKIERLVLFIDNKHQDIIFSLQGESKSITKHFYQVWGLEEIKSALNYKTSKVYELYKFERLQKTEKVGKIVQGTLTIIGASAIIDVALNIIVFSHEDFNKSFYGFGPTYIINKINPDIVLLLSSIIIGWLAVIVFKEMTKK